LLTKLLYVQRKVESPAVFTNVLGIAADAAQNGMTTQLLYQHEAFFEAFFSCTSKPAHTRTHTHTHTCTSFVSVFPELIAPDFVVPLILKLCIPSGLSKHFFSCLAPLHHIFPLHRIPLNWTCENDMQVNTKKLN